MTRTSKTKTSKPVLDYHPGKRRRPPRRGAAETVALGRRIDRLEKQMTAVQIVLRNLIEHIGDIDEDVDELFDNDTGGGDGNGGVG